MIASENLGICFALAFVMAMLSTSARLSYAFTFVMNMLDTQGPQQQAIYTNLYKILEIVILIRFRIPGGGNPKSRDFCLVVLACECFN